MVPGAPVPAVGRHPCSLSPKDQFHRMVELTMAARQAYKAMLQDAHPEPAPRAPPGKPAPGPSPAAEDSAPAPAGTEEPPYRECWAGAGRAEGPPGLCAPTAKSPCPGEQRGPPGEVTAPGQRAWARAEVGLPAEGWAAVWGGPPHPLPSVSCVAPVRSGRLEETPGGVQSARPGAGGVAGGVHLSDEELELVRRGARTTPRPSASASRVRDDVRWGRCPGSRALEAARAAPRAARPTHGRLGLRAHENTGKLVPHVLCGRGDVRPLPAQELSQVT